MDNLELALRNEAQPSAFLFSSTEGKRKRRKRHLAWEQAEFASGGTYTRSLAELAQRHPTLTPMELRVAALVKAMLPSWKIAEMLGICEETVENHRVNIRHKLGVKGGSLTEYLAQL